MEEQKQYPILPWRLWSEMPLNARIGCCIVLVLALVIVTIFNFRVDVSIFEVISGYVTVLFLLWLGVIDAMYKRLPNKILLAWLVIRLLLIMPGAAFIGTEVLISSFAAAATMFIFFLLAYFMSKRTLGGGDVKLGFVLGLALTFNLIFIAVFLALVFSAAFGLAGMFLKKMTRKDMIPLGPFFFAGTLAAYLLALL
ncbi:MAG: A24 family peptidase [Defluviitaleaceae bacterium]|nr:A24 family peptidase [Defluviitaleaceae bacterium]